MGTDAKTLMNFRHLLDAHDLGAALFAKVGELLMANGMKLSGGTIVDATLIAAPPSTKNRNKSRDSEMHQSKKSNKWHFGADSYTGLVHSANVTAANFHDTHEAPTRVKVVVASVMQPTANIITFRMRFNDAIAFGVKRHGANWRPVSSLA
jgi:IS5 family transposase